jgi:hypothetical protein
MFHQLNSTVLVCAGTGLLGVVLPVAAAFLLDSVTAFRRTGRALHLVVTLSITTAVALTGTGVLVAGLSAPSPAIPHLGAVSARFLLLFAPAIALAALAYRFVRIRTRAARLTSLAVSGTAQ